MPELLLLKLDDATLPSRDLGASSGDLGRVARGLVTRSPDPLTALILCVGVPIVVSMRVLLRAPAGAGVLLKTAQSKNNQHSINIV